MRVAIIHYWLVGMRGGEKVIEALCEMYPQADIFTHVYVPEMISEKIRRAPDYSDVHQRATPRGIDVQNLSAPHASGARAA